MCKENKVLIDNNVSADAYIYLTTGLKNKNYITFMLQKAIKNDFLEVYYQPKINLKDEKLIGIEALLRWKDEEFGTISPGEFIPIAEETGIIIELGRYVLKKVCMQIKT